MAQPRSQQLGRIKNSRNFISSTNAITGPAAFFTPAKLFLSGEQGYWLDTSDFTSMFQDSGNTQPVTDVGQTIGSILDKSGRNNHFRQVTATSRPITQRDASGYLGSVLDGIDDSWKSTVTLDLSSSDKVTIVAGVTKTSDANTGIIVEHSSNFNTSPANDGGFYLAGPNAAAATNFTSSSRGTAAAVPGLGSTVINKPSPISGVLTSINDIAGDSTILRFNGSAAAAGVADKGAGNFSNLSHFIGARGGTTLPFTGSIYQIVVINRALTSAELTLIERFVGSKMGISL